MIILATATASPYRSGTLVWIAEELYFCHTSVPLPGITEADIPGNANFALMSGLAAVASTDAFTGDGTPGNDLALNVLGFGFPTIPIVKGGTGAVNAIDARTNLNVAGLESDGSISAGHLAPGGTDTQVLTRTATGKAWEDATGMGGGC